MKNIKYILPNALTLFNLLSGCAAIITVFLGKNEYMAGWLIFLAALFDFLDGFTAKALKAKSEFGVQLDSLADVVSFGVAPTIILFKWIILVLTKNSDQSTFEITSASFSQDLILFCSMFYVMGAALRLARFNVKDLNESGFRGLPTPAAAMTVASIWLLLDSTRSESFWPVILNIYVILILIFLLTALMISTLAMLSLKFDGFSFKKNLLQYILIGSGMVFIILFRIEGIFFTLLLYLLLSVITGLIKFIRI
jgi:CDP-diacylglycerol---serine O-phosphatidyltransferase